MVPSARPTRFPVAAAVVLWLMVSALLATARVSAETQGGTPTPQLWVYAPNNFQVNRSTDALIELFGRAKRAGYSAAVITDYKFGKLDDRPQHFYTNLARTVKAADRLGIELIPCVMPIGYSSSILWNNPDLAEGVPASCVFIARDGAATPANTANLVNGGFEKAARRVPAGWDWIDGFGKSTALDTKVKRSGASSLRMSNFRAGNEVGNARVVVNLKLTPGRQYLLSMWVKTQGLGNPGEFRVAPLVKGGSLNHASLGVEATQDWRRHDIVFNTLEHEAVRLYIGLWGGRSGTIWIDDVVLREAGGINLLRRDGCPVRVSSEDGKVIYEEGRDYERWVNSETGRIPWPGSYRVRTKEPPIRLTPTSRMKQGQRLKVSYHHTLTVNDNQAAACLSHPELYEHLRHQVEMVRKLIKPKRYFMQHDELRLANQCALCRSKDQTAGQLLADNVKRCVKIIREVDPAAGVMVWSDMFDPYHNARANYYLVRGTLAESWQGLDKDVAMVNWNGGRKVASMAFFAKRGHAQVVAGYYDRGNVEAHHQAWADAVAQLKRGIPKAKMTAYMYTTWRNDYRNLERYAKAVRGK